MSKRNRKSQSKSANSSKSRSAGDIKASMESLEPRLLLSAPAVWTATGSGIGGACFSPEINPQNTGEMYINADMHEVWHGTGYNWVQLPPAQYGTAPNSGSVAATWTTLDSVTQIGSGNLNGDVQFTNVNGIQYAINYGQNGNGGPLCKSTDDGTTWIALPAIANTQPLTSYANNTVLMSACHLSVDPNSQTNMVVLTFNSAKWGVYYSSDGGQTFTNIDYGTESNKMEAWLAGAFWDTAGSANTLWLATDNGLYKATNTNYPGSGATAGLASFTGTGITAIAAGAPGANYSYTPQVIITGGGGTGAVYTAIMGSGATAGEVVGFNKVSAGLNYTTQPTVTISAWTWTLTSDPSLSNLQPALNTVFYSFTGSSKSGSTTLAAVTWAPWTTGSTPPDSGSGFHNNYRGIFTDTSPSTDAFWSPATGTSNQALGYVQLAQTSGVEQIDPVYVQMVPNDILHIYVAGGNQDDNDGSGTKGVIPVVYGSADGGADWTRLFQGGDSGIVENGSGATATYTGTLTGGVLQLGTGGVSVSGGSGYISGGVTVKFSVSSGATGSGAIAYATVIGGVVTSVTIVNGGSGYTSAPTVSLVKQEAPNANVYTNWLGDGAGAFAISFDWGGAFDGFTAIAGGTSGAILLACDQGDAFRSDDGGVTWVSVSVPMSKLTPEGQPTPQGINTATMANNETFSPSGINETYTRYLIFPTPTTAFVGAADIKGLAGQLSNGTWGWQNTFIPYNITDGLGSDEINQAAYDPRTGILYASGSVAMLYNGMNAYSDLQLGGSSSAALMASYDMGATWVVPAIHTFYNPNGFSSPIGTITLDPNNPNTMYVGVADSNPTVGGMWMTTDLQDGANSVWTRLCKGSVGIGHLPWFG
jgi:hypothetical protein